MRRQGEGRIQIDKSVHEALQRWPSPSFNTYFPRTAKMLRGHRLGPELTKTYTVERSISSKATWVAGESYLHS